MTSAHLSVLLVALGLTLGVGSASALSPSAAVSVHDVITHYDAVRVALAADDVPTAKAASARLADAARGGSSQPKELRGAYEAIGKAARRLAAAADIAAARLAFGTASRHVIVVLAATPAAAKGWQTYRCPMAKGYKKWAQPGDEMANPYMGKRMLKCGVKVVLEP